MALRLHYQTRSVHSNNNNTLRLFHVCGPLYVCVRLYVCVCVCVCVTRGSGVFRGETRLETHATFVLIWPQSSSNALRQRCHHTRNGVVNYAGLIRMQ